MSQTRYIIDIGHAREPRRSRWLPLLRRYLLPTATIPFAYLARSLGIVRYVAIPAQRLMRTRVFVSTSAADLVWNLEHDTGKLATTPFVWLVKRLALAGRYLYLVVTFPFTQEVSGLGLALLARTLWLGVSTPLVYLGTAVMVAGGYLGQGIVTISTPLGRGTAWVAHALWLGVSTPLVYLGTAVMVAGGYLGQGIVTISTFLGRGTAWVAHVLWLGLPFPYLANGAALVRRYSSLALAIPFKYLRGRKAMVSPE